MATQTTTSTSSLPEIYNPAIQAYVNAGLGFAQPFLNGTAQMPRFDPSFAVPGFNWAQSALVDPAYQMLQRQSPGMQTADASNRALQSTLGGQFYGRQTQTNPYQGLFAQPGVNPYMGMNNPYLQQTINSTLGDMVSNYRTGTAAQLDAAAARAGAFGGSGHSEAIGRNEKQLAQQLGNTANQMRYQDYGAQMGLQENAINRMLGAQQTDLARNAGLAGQQIGLNEQSFQNERQRALQAAGLAPAMVGVDAASMTPLRDIGNAAYGIQREQNQFQMNQDLRTMYPQLFGMDILRGIIPGQTGGTTTTSYSQPGTNTAAQIIGGIGTIGGLLGGLF